MTPEQLDTLVDENLTVVAENDAYILEGTAQEIMEDMLAYCTDFESFPAADEPQLEASIQRWLINRTKENMK